MSQALKQGESGLPRYASYAEWMRATDEPVELLEQRNLPGCQGVLSQALLAEAFDDPATDLAP